MRIELRQVAKRFGRTRVLKGIDLVIPPGRRVALVGPNGSGKSTLLRAVIGLLDCTGQVLLDGRSPYENRVEVVRQLAYVPQVAPQLSATVAEVLGLVTLTRGLEPSAIADAARELELDVAEVKRRPFRNLSGGMKQKLLIAIALAARPSLLLMDEPTASLDARARDRLFALCEPGAGVLPGGATLLLCSHRLEELRQLVDHVVALEDGKVAFDGPARGFFGAPALSVIEGQRSSSPPPEPRHG